MALLNPASISLGDGDVGVVNGDGEEEITVEGGVPAVGASVVIEEGADEVVMRGDVDRVDALHLDRVDLESSEEVGVSHVYEYRAVPGSRRTQHSIPHFTQSMIKEESSFVSSQISYRRFAPDKLTAQMVEDYVKIVTGRVVGVVDEEYRRQLNALAENDDYSLTCEIYDEILGHLEYAIVHLPSKKLLLTDEQKHIVLQALVDRFKSDRQPIGSCLQFIQTNYIGFPPVIKLRNALLDCLSQVTRVAVDDVSCTSREYSMMGGETSDFGKNSTEAKLLNDEDGKGKRARRPNVRAYKGGAVINVSTPIPDNQYDILAQVLAGKMSEEDIENWMIKEAVKARLTGDFIAEYWNEPQEFLSAGWRIRMKDSLKIVVRKSEVDEIWRRCSDALGPDCSQKQILYFLESKYVGISSKSRLRLANKYMLLKGNRVQFPTKPRCIGSKPMQYVQIDMIEMESSEYGERCYTMALLVTDLYSQFVFGRALADVADSSLLVRHLMDIFGAFAPPEAYRSFTNNAVIEHVMSDIEKLFKVQIKNVGQGVMCHYTLRASIYKRAEEELGSRERWVESLPFAVIDYNQRPLKGFGDVRISPFEIMFGRRPWKHSSYPPWIYNVDEKYSDEDLDYNEAEDEQKQTMEDISAERMDVDGRVLSPMLPRVSKFDAGVSITNIYLGDMSENRSKISYVLGRYPVKFDENGDLVDPGTGFMFEVGDHVYMRNIVHKDFFNKTRKRANMPRYFRATVAEVDRSNPDFMYKVYYWDDVGNVDLVNSDQWPEEGSLATWTSPYDIAPSTPDLSRRRNIVRRREMQFQCKCGYDFCELVFNEKCPYKLSQACCQRLRMSCPFHQRKSTELVAAAKKDSVGGGAPPRTFMQHELRKSIGKLSRHSTDTERNMFMRDIKPKWTYQNGRIVELPPSAPCISDASHSRAHISRLDRDEHMPPAKRCRTQYDQLDVSADEVIYTAEFDDEFDEAYIRDDSIESSIAARVVPLHQLVDKIRAERAETIDIMNVIETSGKGPAYSIQCEGSGMEPCKDSQYLDQGGTDDNLTSSTNHAEHVLTSAPSRNTRSFIASTALGRDGTRKRGPPIRLSPNPS